MDEPEIDTEVPHPARVWNYLLGGKDNYPVDRAAGDQAMEVLPEVAQLARESRQFLNRAVSYLVEDAGMRQFLDIGTGLPTADNTHEVAQRSAPGTRVVYADRDPLVLAHARALLTSTPEGACDYVHADLRDPAAILDQAARTLDFTEPITLMLMGITEFIPDDGELSGIIDHLVSALPRGSHLALYATTNVVHGERTDEAIRMWNQADGTASMTARPVAQIAGFFHGLDLVAPGLVEITQWRPVHPDLTGPPVDGYAAIGRKP
ncbi:SAM-dependent methyltransferase [Actinomadura sp. BRA 177]|uniref:SAM-dependent methyltransferase n=1 Tax=Actinomadura sp. BRA 177 TaxID=2745202 RepID=UPI001595EC89|nr:SAM-dependent methyltransferase [Actinomadura sp. BRA 177]NVI90020.1 SAM-dependent methyltransferase [Actinomadura sp. BRA 177]